MAILLKDQISSIIKEISYHAPTFNRDYYERAHDSLEVYRTGAESGKRMFYDFYAMDLLWKTIGSGKYPKEMRSMQKDMPEDDPSKYFHSLIKPQTKMAGKGKDAAAPPEAFQVGGDIVPEGVVRAIDKIHDEVVRGVARNLLTYVRMAIVQEFQYLTSSSGSWTRFRNHIVSEYNSKHSFTIEDYKKYVRKDISDMARFPDTIYRLLKFSKFYSKMMAFDHSDPFDIVAKVVSEPVKAKAKPEEPAVTAEPVPSSSTEPEPEEPEPTSPPMPGPQEPDETDYEAPPVEVPAGADQDENPPTEKPKKDPSGYEDEPDYYKKKDDVKEGLITEENISVDIILNVYGAMRKSGVTIEDIEIAYNNLDWTSSIGGPRWGDGAIALIKLADAKKNLDTEDYVYIIDHIYDLQHNTGSLLNKGPMVIDDKDLDFRFRVTHPARLLNRVSPMIRRLLVRYMKYFPNTDEQIQLSTDQIVASPSVPFSQAEITYLTSKRFTPDAGNDFSVPVEFVKSRPNADSRIITWEYTIKKHQNGFISLADDHQADIQIFKDFEQAKAYIEQKLTREIPDPGGHSAVVRAAQSDKDKYLHAHSTIKLDTNKEIALLKIDMGWESHEDRYKAHFPGAKRFYLYAFNNGTFLTTWKGQNTYQVFTSWDKAYEYCRNITKDANEFPDKDALMATLKPAPAYASTSATAPAPIKAQGPKYVLSEDEKNDLTAYVLSQSQAKFGSSTHLSVDLGSDGMYIIKKEGKSCFGVGKKTDVGFWGSMTYRVLHFLGVMSSFPEEFSFPDWAKTKDFITTKFDQLLIQTSLSKQASTVTAGIYSQELPPNAASKAIYTAHVGITTPPKASIRLTKEDEDIVKKLGFEPQSIAPTGVWYVHKTIGDSIKFFPNNTAKIIFKQKGGVPMVNFSSIQKALDWLPSKYSATSQISPIAATPATAKKGGIQLSSMFEKRLQDIGFKWNAAQGKYQHGNNTLLVNKNRSSELTVPGGESQSFATLPELFDYLESEYS